jgi:hypothetical protein
VQIVLLLVQVDGLPLGEIDGHAACSWEGRCPGGENGRKGVGQA